MPSGSTLLIESERRRPILVSCCCRWVAASARELPAASVCYLRALCHLLPCCLCPAASLRGRCVPVLFVRALSTICCPAASALLPLCAGVACSQCFLFALSLPRHLLPCRLCPAASLRGRCVQPVLFVCALSAAPSAALPASALLPPCPGVLLALACSSVAIDLSID